jgi:hypothetical protein
MASAFARSKSLGAVIIPDIPALHRNGCAKGQSNGGGFISDD